MKAIIFLFLLGATHLVATPAHAWKVTREKGEMNDKPVVIACVESENSIQMMFETAKARLCVRLINERIDAAVVSPMTSCWVNIYDHYAMSIRADDQPAERFVCAGTDGGSTNVGFFSDNARSLQLIRSAKRLLRVEVPLVSYGDAVFRFNVAGKKLPRELLK